MTKIKQRLEEIRASLRAENISYGELAELQELADYIEPGDVELLEAAGVPERTEEGEERLAELLEKHDTEGYAGLTLSEQQEFDRLYPAEDYHV